MTKDFYNENALEYYNTTINAKSLDNIEKFCKNLEPNGFILDLGCGSGRDSLIFKEKEFLVLPIDFSEELAEVTLKETGLKVFVRDFTKMDNFGDNLFSGIWANASLLHIDRENLMNILPKLYKSLSINGFMYISLKPSDKDYIEEYTNGRFFAKYNKKEIERIFNELNIPIFDFWITTSVIDENQKWFNILIKKES